MNSQLAVEALDVAYGEFQVLWEARLEVAAGEIVALLGPNGAGKSTLVNTVSGLLRPRAGSITFEGRRIDGMPAHRTADAGIAHVLERRRLFPFLTVHDNVLLGAHNPRARTRRAETLARVERIFPVVRERRDQLAHTLSGGEQQMVAIARGIALAPTALFPAAMRATLDVSERTDVRGWRMGQGGGSHLDLTTTPSFRLGLTSRRTNVSLGYSARLAFRDITTSFNPDLLQSGNLGLEWLATRRVRLTLVVRGSAF